ncbi:nuclear transport factor 2 family protein [Shewanella woodyi]|uniref:nuclear transport factor 2 family protein n=1 Tax=Shewanella woodyi TaxID=60961 RepID=UPI0037489CEF
MRSNFKLIALKPFISALLIIAASLNTSAFAKTTDHNAEQVLDKLHQTASDGDWDSYFSLYLPDAIFIGTDANEHWTMKEFQQYARPTQGWTYTLKSRKLNTVQKLNKVIVFDELLDSQSYGISRGTGTLVLTDMGWKIAQYHLSFPIPNAIAKEITATIKLQ